VDCPLERSALDEFEFRLASHVENFRRLDLFSVNSRRLRYRSDEHSFRSFVRARHRRQHTRPRMISGNLLEIFRQACGGEGPLSIQAGSRKPPAGDKVIKQTSLARTKNVTLGVAYPEQ